MIKSLAYLGVNSPHTDDWPASPPCSWAPWSPPGPEGAVRLRFDDARGASRSTPPIMTRPPSSAGGSTTKKTSTVVAKPSPARGRRERGTRALAEARAVNRLLAFTDPWGFPHEVIWGQHLYPSTFRPGRASCGLRHRRPRAGATSCSWMPDIEAGHEFFSGLLGFALSD